MDGTYLIIIGGKLYRTAVAIFRGVEVMHILKTEKGIVRINLGLKSLSAVWSNSRKKLLKRN
ncbi:hypothetical protein TU58_30495 [Bacillus cereus]|nr:hypothetical protein TU58_30495 [Bacillus cereus]